MQRQNPQRPANTKRQTDAAACRLGDEDGDGDGDE